MKTTRARVLAGVLFGLLAGIAITQPVTSNWMEQGGLIWHIGGDLDVETGGEIDVESGGSLIADSGSTVTVNTTATLASAVKVSGTNATGTVTLASTDISATVSGLALGDSDYSVMFEPTANVSVMAVSSKSATGFTVTYQTGSGSPSVRYYIIHHQ